THCHDASFEEDRGMTDIVTRLRSMCRLWPEHSMHYSDAANEIERLRKALVRVGEALAKIDDAVSPDERPQHPHRVLGTAQEIVRAALDVDAGRPCLAQ